jgi:hypothetical protein
MAISAADACATDGVEDVSFKRKEIDDCEVGSLRYCLFKPFTFLFINRILDDKHFC